MQQYCTHCVPPAFDAHIVVHHFNAVLSSARVRHLNIRLLFLSLSLRLSLTLCLVDGESMRK